MGDWLPGSHLAWLVIEMVEQVDTSAFHRRSRLGGVGRAGFDPDLLVALLLYAYCVGVRSSRQIERLCEVDVAFRVVSADDRPDHSTIARFRQAHDEAFVALFTQVLMMAAAAGLGRFGTVAVDGTKVAANASVDANRDERWLREQAQRLVAEAAALDAVEDAEFGAARGDELPAEWADPQRRAGAVRDAVADLERRRRAGQQKQQQQSGQGEQPTAEQRQRRRERKKNARRQAKVAAALADLEQRRRAEQERERAEKAVARARAEERARQWAEGEPRSSGPVEVGSAVAVAEARLARAQQEQQDKLDQAAATMTATGRRPSGRWPVPVEQHGTVRRARRALERARQRQAREEEKRAQRETGPSRPRANLTDPDCRIMPTRKGWIQGYNTQLAVAADQLILAVEVSQSTEDSAAFAPMMAAAQEAAAGFRACGRDDAEIGTVLADAGYATNDNLDCTGPDRLIALGKSWTQHQAALTDPAVGDPPEDASAREKMAHRLRTPDGALLYRRRGATVEPAIGNLKKIIDRMSRRGLAAARAEIHLAATAFNLLKIYRLA